MRILCMSISTLDCIVTQTGRTFIYISFCCFLPAQLKKKWKKKLQPSRNSIAWHRLKAHTHRQQLPLDTILFIIYYFILSFCCVACHLFALPAYCPLSRLCDTLEARCQHSWEAAQVVAICLIGRVRFNEIVRIFAIWRRRPVSHCIYI